MSSLAVSVASKIACEALLARIRLPFVICKQTETYEYHDWVSFIKFNLFYISNAIQNCTNFVSIIINKVFDCLVLTLKIIEIIQIAVKTRRFSKGVMNH